MVSDAGDNLISTKHRQARTESLTVPAMAAELQPPENQIPSTTAATVSTSTTNAALTTAVSTPATASLPAVNIDPPPGPPLTTKRQRRPSVRLGEIGDQTSYDSHLRRTKPQWRLPKDHHNQSSSKSVKARSLTNLVNGGGVVGGEDYQESDEKNHNNGGEVEFTHRKVKSKRAPIKRPRTNWFSRIDDEADQNQHEHENEGEEEENFREFDPESDSQMKEQSPVNSVDNAGIDYWPSQRRPGTGRVRVSENEFDNNLNVVGDGVRSWLIELGLSRYASVFEIHEVDDEVLPMLTLEDLKDMGINAVGSRRKLYTAIQKLRKGFS